MKTGESTSRSSTGSWSTAMTLDCPIYPRVSCSMRSEMMIRVRFKAWSRSSRWTGLSWWRFGRCMTLRTGRGWRLRRRSRGGRIWRSWRRSRATRSSEKLGLPSGNPCTTWFSMAEKSRCCTSCLFVGSHSEKWWVWRTRNWELGKETMLCIWRWGCRRQGFLKSCGVSVSCGVWRTFLISSSCWKQTSSTLTTCFTRLWATRRHSTSFRDVKDRWSCSWWSS